MEDNTTVEMEQRRYEGPLARSMEEMTLIAADLEVAYKQIVLYHSHETTDPSIREALFNSAVVLFTACFDRNNKFRLDPDVVFAGSEGASEFMDWIWGIRNSHVAHAFGATRQAVTAVSISALPPFLAEGAGPVMMRYSGMGDADSPEELDNIIRPWAVAWAYADAKAGELRKQVLEEVVKLSREDLDRLDPIAVLTVPDLSDIVSLKSRGKFDQQERLRRKRQEPADLADQKPQTR